MEKAQLTKQIKERALQLGFSAVGAAPVSAAPEQHLRMWLARSYQGRMAYMERNTEKRLDPGQVLEGARSILCVALNYFHPYQLPYDQPSQGVISRYASGADYHRVMEEKLQQLLEFTQQLQPGTRGKMYVDTGPVLDKYWAERAGVGWLGKHTNLLARDLGSWFFLGEILLDLELEYDAPGLDFCGSCRRCIDACPTDAIVEPYLLDSRRCISYLTIELREDIPEEFRESMGNLVFGCDICQDVCPWNRKAPLSTERGFEPHRPNQSPQLRELARLSPQDFRRRFQDSPVQRTRWRGFMRNVAVAMGNARDPEMLPELVGLLEADDAMVRRHAAWALARIGTPEAREALRRRRQVESDEETLTTLDNLLRLRPLRIFTIGHSTRSFPEFLNLLQAQGIERLVDVRSFPSSRKFPHFNQEAMQRDLRRAGVEYHHLKSLGGLRKSGLPDSPNRAWSSPGFRNYADHMRSEEFRGALDRLLEIAAAGNTAIMCAERLPWRCHRQLIADALVGLKQIPVIHIVDSERTEEHRVTRFARVERGELTYPAHSTSIS